MRSAQTSRAASVSTSAAPLDLWLAGCSVWWVIALFLAAFAVYWPALSGALLWDDSSHLTKPELRSLGGLARIWFEIGAAQQYYPVLHSAFWLQHLVFGDAPLGYHVINVALHATAAALFATALRRLGVRGAGLAAFLFLLHPVCVESVAWISEQKNTLSLVFYLLAGLAYLRFDRTRRFASYAGATVLFLFALGSKTVTASLPAALLVIFWWQRGRLEWRRDVAPLLPWFGLAAAAGATTAWVEHVFINEGYEYELDFLQRTLLAGRVIWFYAGKLLLPVDLMFIYPRWTIDASVWWQWIFLLGLLLAGAAAWRWRRHRGPIAAGLFFAGSLFPALGFVNVYPFVFSFVADHFQYLASLGFFALAGAALALGVSRRPARQAALVTLGLLAALGALSWQQSTLYRDNVTLYQATLAKNPAAAMVHHNLAQELVDLGRRDEAMPHLEAAIRLRPDSVKAAYNYGRALLDQQDFAAAIPYFQRAIELKPDHAFAHYDLGFSQMTLHQFEPAETHLRTAVALRPDHGPAQFNLGLMLVRRGDHAAAIRHFAAAARLLPEHPEAELNWGTSLLALERVGEALPHFARAAQLAPDRADVQRMFARARAIGEHLDAAIAQQREALARDPNSVELHSLLAETLRLAGHTADAERHRAEASRLGGKK
jgi:protein O-mannosyl-transferase